jgi:Mrp family chromosome partitioning ATPase
MTVTVEQVNAALAGVVDPNTGKDLVSSRSARNVRVDGGQVSVDVELGYPAKSQLDPIRRAVVGAVRSLPGVDNVSANVYQKIIAHAVQRGVKLLPGVKNIVAVASGKGGVGKSTTAVNLALALSAEGATVGMLDADIYGPSQPQMLGISGKPETVDGKTLEPMEGHGIQASSIGFLIDTDTPMVWRGPMVTQALEQLLRETNWRDLDYLVVDLPPGTGDIHLTLSQKIPVTGAVIVTTPQDIALLDAQGAQDVREGGHPHPRHRREHGDSRLHAVWPRRAHLRRGRGRADVERLRRRVPRRAAARHPDPRAGRLGSSHGGGRPRRRDRDALQGHRPPRRGEDRRQREGHDLEVPVDHRPEHLTARRPASVGELAGAVSNGI